MSKSIEIEVFDKIKKANKALERLLSALVVWFALCGCSYIPDETAERQKLAQDLVLVTKVIDGDTFWINDGEKEVKVRFIGIDAPETRNTGRKKKGYYGVEAKTYVIELTENQWVRLEYDVRKKDQYQRLLAYVYREDGTFLNAHLVENGYAVVDTHPPNVKYVDLFIELQRMARQEKRGLWAE